MKVHNVSQHSKALEINKSSTVATESLTQNFSVHINHRYTASNNLKQWEIKFPTLANNY